jgi:hypothetical protein
MTFPLIQGLAKMTVAPFLPEFLVNPWFQLALATPVQFWAGSIFYVGAIKATPPTALPICGSIQASPSNSHGFPSAPRADDNPALSGQFEPPEDRLLGPR